MENVVERNREEIVNNCFDEIWFLMKRNEPTFDRLLEEKMNTLKMQVLACVRTTRHFSGGNTPNSISKGEQVRMSYSESEDVVLGKVNPQTAQRFSSSNIAFQLTEMQRITSNFERLVRQHEQLQRDVAKKAQELREEVQHQATEFRDNATLVQGQIQQALQDIQSEQSLHNVVPSSCDGRDSCRDDECPSSASSNNNNCTHIVARKQQDSSELSTSVDPVSPTRKGLDFSTITDSMTPLAGTSVLVFSNKKKVYHLQGGCQSASKSRNAGTTPEHRDKKQLDDDGWNLCQYCAKK